jgi:UDP-2,3-diacylglucosamine hydrolase
MTVNATTPDVRPVGLLAGSGRFPILFAEKARSQGLPVVCVGIKYEADPMLQSLAHRFHWCGIAKLGRMIRCFHREGVREIVMAGKVRKAQIYSPWRFFQYLPDFRFLRLWWRRQWRREDNKDDTMLLALISEFAGEGMSIHSALEYCPELLVREGVLTRRKPTTLEEVDIKFGWHLAREMGRLDVGQSVVVKERAVIAVEAIEGTDRNILRAGEFCPAGGFTVVKVAKPNQDMRFDVPTIGPSTIETMHKARGRVLAIEAHKTIILDEPETVALANRCGITIIALVEPSV